MIRLMPRFEQDSDATALGAALASLRRAAGLSQAEAGAAAGMTSQGWGLYEAGKRPGLFRPDIQRRLTAAVGGSPESLALALANGTETVAPTVASGVEARGRDYDAGQARPRTIETLQLSNDDLAPWAASGVVLEYDAGRWPRRDQGCVIDTIDGRSLVRLYDRADGEMLYLKGGRGGLRAIETIRRDETVRVCAVTARRDE